MCVPPVQFFSTEELRAYEAKREAEVRCPP